MTLHGHHHLLRGKTVPAPQRLGIFAAVSVIIRHVFAHNAGRIAGNIETGFEAVLQLHTGGIFRINGGPCRTGRFDLLGFLSHEISVFRHLNIPQMSYG